MAKRLLCLFVLAAICLIGSTEMMAQVASTGQLVGTVTDQTGAVIAGATVKIKDDATGTLFETKSTADGHFAAASLRPGTYTVTVSLQGFKSAEYRAVKIIIGQVYDLAAKLEVGALESTVVVEAGAEVLETVSTTIGTSITGKQITQLPLSSR
ncbi:MAG: carboxypeptidase regulatory-like domain-containing protein, partial [Acidobacteria bacterium]|nr:carboxypeptidase regulatory-like domain-containing protein [Acidobacteriota bacterium]